MAAAIRLYLDENVPVAIAEQMARRGIEVVTARDLGTLHDSDINHLNRATQMGYVLCTYDSDYIQLTKTGIAHAGIVKGRLTQHRVGEWVKGLELICGVLTADDMKNHIEFL